MSIVSLLNVTVLNNPARFMDPYEFEITFECLEPLQDDLEWKLVYVGASKSSKHDQELDSLLVGPVPQGVNRFVFQTDPPNPELIPQDQLVSITVMLLSCSYRDREFVQVGYYVNNEYDTEELRENPPTGRVALEHVVRNILAEKPRVTKYNIPWDSEETEQYPPEQLDADADLDADEETYGNEEDDQRDEMIDQVEAGDVEVDGEEAADEDADEDEDEDADEDADDDDDEVEDEDEAEDEAEDEVDEEEGEDEDEDEDDENSAREEEDKVEDRHDDPENLAASNDM